MSVRSVCMILVMSVVFTIPALLLTISLGLLSISIVNRLIGLVFTFSFQLFLLLII